MARRIGFELRRLLDERKLIRIRRDRKLVVKEMEGARSDLEEARDSIKRKKFKWATIQGYYSMFHSARALVYSKGLREKSHYALLVALRELFMDELGKPLVDSFEEAMDLRQEADYGLRFSEVGAMDVVENAKRFLNRTLKILEPKR